MRNRALFLMEMTLLLACLSARAVEPSVSISTSFAKSAGKAVTCKCVPDGTFTASPSNAPIDRAETKVTGPVYAWTISPTNHVSFAPTNAPTVDLSLLNTNAFGKTYDVSVVVTWFESNTVTHAVTPIPATMNMVFIAIKAELKSVKFTSDHGLLTTNKTDWNDCKVRYTKPEWVKNTVTNNPISQTMNTKLAADVEIKIEPSGVAFDLIGTGNTQGFSFSNFCHSSSQVFPVVAKTNLSDKVCILESGISWKMEVGSLECSLGSSGDHKIYVTYGTPAGSDVTEMRVFDVCTAAKDQLTIASCATNISKHLASCRYSGDDVDGPVPIWLIHDNRSSQCPGLAKFINAHFSMLGLGSGKIVYCRVTPDGDYIGSDNDVGLSRPCTDGCFGHLETTHHDDLNVSEFLWMIDRSGNANNFEAACLFNGQYFAVGVGVYNSPKEVVIKSFGGPLNIGWFYFAIQPPPNVIVNVKYLSKCGIQPWIEK